MYDDARTRLQEHAALDLLDALGYPPSASMERTLDGCLIVKSRRKSLRSKAEYVLTAKISPDGEVLERNEEEC